MFFLIIIKYSMSKMKYFPCIKTYLRMKLLGKLWILMHFKNLVLNTFHIIGHTFLMSPQEYGHKVQVQFFKLLMTMKQIYHKNRVTSSSYFQLIMINMRRLFHTTILSITSQTSSMEIFFGDSNALFQMR